MRKKEILIVEDDKLVVQILTNQLRDPRYQVTVALSVPEALRVLRGQKPDLMILDLSLSENDRSSGLTDGLAFLALFRRNHPEVDIPVIIHSIDDSPKMKARAESMGVAAVLKKGCPIDELLSAVRETLNEHEGKPDSAQAPATERDCGQDLHDQ